MNHAEIEFIRQVATAVKWAIEADVEGGKAFQTAKRERIKQAEPSWRMLAWETRQAVLAVCWSIAPADLSPATRRRAKARHLEEIERARGSPAGRVERLLYRLTGLCF